jgi:hypothetical protein
VLGHIDAQRQFSDLFGEQFELLTHHHGFSIHANILRERMVNANCAFG